MRRKSLQTIFIITGLLFFLATAAHAATITVANTNDAGGGSLRQAITNAAAGDTIDFGVTGTITLTTGELVISKNLTITGPGAASLTIDGNNSSRIFMVNSGFTLTLSGVTIDNGNSATWGGGIANEGTLHISDSVITNCDANGGGNGYGGGIDTWNGTVTVTNCTLTGNTAVNQGGAIRAENGSLTITESTIDGNTTDNGGGIYSLNTTVDVIRSTIYNNNATAGGSNHGGGIFGHGGTLNVTNSTISGNNSVGGGGGIIDGAVTTMNINSCTIAYNVSTNGGGGMEMDFTTANIKNTILAHNTGGGANNFFSGGGALNSQGYNLENGTECGFSGTGDQQSVSAGIDPIADNGGPTQTHALQAGSSALDVIPGPGYNGAPGTDQRGVARPQSAGADCGAFELKQAPLVTTQAVSAIAAATATGNGTITSLGAPDPTAHGMVWNLTGSPTLADNSSDEGAAAATGAFTSNMTGLSPYTTYYVKAYAANANGTAYGNEVSFTTQGIAPAVTTQAVSGIGTTTATGNGTITTLGVPAPTAHGMVWNTTGNPTLADSSSNEGPAGSTGPFTSNMTGLSTGVTYYVKAYATNATGTAYGNEVSFTTATQPAAVTTQAVTGIGTAAAAGNGTITGLGAPNPTAHGMVWNTTGNPTLADSSSNEGPAGSTGPFTSSMTGLSAGVTYYVKAYATNLAGTVYGNEVSFTTATQPAAVTTQAVTGIGTAAAAGNGNITGLGAPNPTAHGMVWNTTGTPTLADSSSNEGAAGSTGPFTSNMTGLSAGVTYYVRAYATNPAGTVYGNEVSFTTTTQPAALTTQPVTGIGTAAATGNGTITGLGAPNPTAHGMVWNTTGTPTLADSSSNEGVAAFTGAFTSDITGLSPNTTYYVRAYATNTAGTVYGGEVNFTTKPQLPAVTTQAVTPIDPTTATGNGTIEDLGVPNPTAHGMVWNVTGVPPTLADNFTDEGPVSATGAFTSLMTGLSPDTTYYVRAYATNAAGTAYGNKVIFNNGGGLPSVSTTMVSDITDTTATGGGKVTDEGGDTVTARGVCWSTSSRPTAADDHTDDGTGSGWFTSYLTGLTPATTYSYRAYATNSFGTAYGREKTFTTKGRPEPPTVEIIEPEDDANVSGVVTIKAKAESGQGIKNVEFFVDGDKIGDGTITQANRNTLTFDLSGAETLFIDDNNRLQKTDKKGNRAAVINGDIETAYIQAGPDGSIYVNFESPRRLADGNRYVLVKVNPADGSYTGIDSQMSGLFTGFTTHTALRFDRAGNLFYLAAHSDGKLYLKQVTKPTPPLRGTPPAEGNSKHFVDSADDVNTLLLFNEDTEIKEWFVEKDGTVILAGKTLSTGDKWLKSKVPGAAPNHLTDLYSDIRKIAASANGYTYAVTEAEAYRVSGNQAVEISPARLPADIRNHDALPRNAAPGKEIDLECVRIQPLGKLYSIDWDASLYDFGLHTITAAAHDNIDQTAEDRVSVNIPEIILTLTASRETERAWIISRLYGKLEILAVNLSDVPVAEYVIYRKVEDAALKTIKTHSEEEFKAIATFTDADLEDGIYTYDDKYLDNDKTYTYKVEAKDENDEVIAVSEKITI